MKMNKLLIILTMLFMLNIVKGDTAWCQDSYACPFPYASTCQCQSDLNGKPTCYIVPCGDINNDGCYELDYNHKTRCTSGQCEQKSQYTAVCKNEPSGCPADSCVIGQTQCYGEWVDLVGDTKYSRICEDSNADGCGEWSQKIVCPVYCDKNTQTCLWNHPPCQDSCVMPQIRCRYGVPDGQDYTDDCGLYGDDGCYHYYSEIYPQSLGVNEKVCPFGCIDPQSDGHAVCYVEPHTCASECSANQTTCSGDGQEVFICQNDTIHNCMRYMVNDLAISVEHCPYGKECVQKSQGLAVCSGNEYLTPTLNRSYTIPNLTLGIGVIGQYFYFMDGFRNVYVYDKNLNYISSITLTNCSGVPSHFSLPSDYAYLSSDTTYLYFSWYDSSNDVIISKFTQDGKCLNNIVNYTAHSGNLTLGLQSFDVTDNFVWGQDYYGNVVKFDKLTGNLTTSFTDTSWYQYAFVCGDDNNAWVTDWTWDGSWHYYLKQYDSNGISLNNVLTTVNRTYSCKIDKKTLYLETGYLTPPFNFLVYNYGEGSNYHRCFIGSKYCVGSAFYNSKPISPFLVYCQDMNGDGIGDMPDTIYDGLSVGMSCTYGCAWNNTIGDVECRNAPPLNCTQKQWTCPQPDATKCENGYIYKCSDPTNSNCYSWVQQSLCRGGCDEMGGCKQCMDECKPTESKCFPNGFTGVDYDKQQSIWYNVPMTMNCTYDYNGKCWVWDLTSIERCVNGCFNNFTVSDNTTHGYCLTQAQINDYGLGNYTEGFTEMFAELGSLLSISLPEGGTRYAVSSFIIIGLTAFIGFVTRKIKITIYSMGVLALVISLIGWLPIWITPIVIVLSGLWLGRKYFLGGN